MKTLPLDNRSSRPTDKVVVAMIEAVQADLEQIKTLFPLVREHSHRNDGPPACSGELDLLRYATRKERDPEPLDKQALRFFIDTLKRFIVARQMLAARLPALEAKMQGRHLEDVAPVGSRAVTDGACIVCENVVSYIRRGMCWSDYQAWLKDGRPDIGPWTARRRIELAEAA